MVFRVVKVEENVLILDEIGFGGRGHGEERGGRRNKSGYESPVEYRTNSSESERERRERERAHVQRKPAMMQQVAKQPQIDVSVSYWIRAGYLISTEARSHRGRFPSTGIKRRIR